MARKSLDTIFDEYTKKFLTNLTPTGWLIASYAFKYGVKIGKRLQAEKDRRNK